jgi:hypothetical protein
MVFRHYGLPSVNEFGNYQCGIVAAYFGGTCRLNCGLCVAPIQGMAELQKVVNQYGLVARSVSLSSPVLTSQLVFRALSMSEVKTEIDANRPIISGITAGGFPFPNFSQHVVVVVGYRDTSDPHVIVNDPFPYDLPIYIAQGRSNPYIAAGASRIAPGRYEIPYRIFVNSFAWGNTIYNVIRLPI